MPRALEVIAGFASSPGATLTSLTMASGNSATIRGTDTTKGTWLLSTWGYCNTAGELRITSPRLHDQAQGIRNRVTAALAGPLVPGFNNSSYAQRLYAQDNLTIQQSGDAAAYVCANLLIGYDDLAGIAGRFIDQATLKKHGINIVTAEVTVTAVATGNWGGAVAINSSYDTLIANTDYAVLGMMTDTRGCGLGLTAVDFGNLRVGCPAEPSMRYLTQNWFESLASAFNAPYIPVFNSANKTTTLVDVQTTATGGTYIINIELVQLAPGSVPAPATQTTALAQPGA